jgi:hypothetical protein
LHGDNDTITGLYKVHNVISNEYYEVEFPSAATKTIAKGGGKKVRVYETKHDVSFPEMNEAWRQQDTAFMNRVARYCIQDTLLPQMILGLRFFLSLDRQVIQKI